MEEIFNSKAIKNYMKKYQLTKKEFCRLCDISAYVFDKMMNKGVIISCRTYIKIAQATKLKFAELYRKKTTDSRLFCFVADMVAAN